MAANVTILHRAFSDPRVRYLAKLAGYVDEDHALGKLARLWSRCTELQNPTPSVADIRACLGPRGEEHLVESGLGELLENGEIRVRGCTGQIEWYNDVRPGAPRQTAGGKARAANAARDARGRLLPASAVAGSSNSASASSNSRDRGRRETSAPATSPATEVAGASILPATSSSPSSNVTSNPPLAGELLESSDIDAGPLLDVAGPATLQQPSNPPASDLDSGSEDTHTRARAIPPSTEPTPVRPNSWHRRKSWWDSMLEAHDRLRKPTATRPAIKPGTPDLARHPNERALLECERFLREAGYNDDGIDAKMRHVVLVHEAEAERLEHLDYFKPAIIWDTTRADRFPRKVDTTLEEARRGPMRERTPARPNGAAAEIQFKRDRDESVAAIPKWHRGDS